MAEAQVIVLPNEGYVASFVCMLSACIGAYHVAIRSAQDRWFGVSCKVHALLQLTLTGVF